MTSIARIDGTHRDRRHAYEIIDFLNNSLEPGKRFVLSTKRESMNIAFTPVDNLSIGSMILFYGGSAYEINAFDNAKTFKGNELNERSEFNIRRFKNGMMAVRGSALRGVDLHEYDARLLVEYSVRIGFSEEDGTPSEDPRTRKFYMEKEGEMDNLLKSLIGFVEGKDR